MYSLHCSCPKYNLPLLAVPLLFSPPARHVALRIRKQRATQFEPDAEEQARMQGCAAVAKSARFVRLHFKHKSYAASVSLISNHSIQSSGERVGYRVSIVAIEIGRNKWRRQAFVSEAGDNFFTGPVAFYCTCLKPSASHSEIHTSIKALTYRGRRRRRRGPKVNKLEFSQSASSWRLVNL